MTNTKTKIAMGIAGMTALFLIGSCNNNSGSVGGGTVHYQAIQIPADVAQTSAVSPGQFNTWFASGTATANGAVVPANSVTFPANPSDSNFYKWSEQMFLWITSRTGNGSLVLENNSFFMVLPDSANTHREMIQCTPGNFQSMASIKNFVGHNQSFVQDRKGKTWRVLLPAPDAADKSMVASDNGVVKVVRLEKNAVGGHTLFDEKGNAIVHPHAVMDNRMLGSNVAKKVMIGDKAVLLSANGEVDADAETAQATGNALIAQNGSLVHYILFVNDFYAYYATGKKNGAFKGTAIDSLFPTDTIGRNLVCRYARRVFGVTINDSNALAMELKTSWVEVNGQLLDQDKFITVKATIPQFNKINDSTWKQNEHQVDSATLALTGMHILGSVYGHPEMIWATIEHQSNAPDNAYYYTDTVNGGTVVRHPADACGGKWLLDDTTCANENLNGLTSNRSKGRDTISSAGTGSPIGPRNVRRQDPWGNFDTASTDTRVIAQNTMVMSVNNSVRGQLNALGSDIRANYIFVGALWTSGGVTPNPSGGFQVPADTINSRGGVQLANTTMETYMTLSIVDGGCFDCHNSSLNPSVAFDLSHIFSEIDTLKGGLPPVPPAVKNIDAAKKSKK